MAKEFKWYVVWHGRATGVFPSWEECRLQVENFQGAQYKSYTTKEKAVEAYRNNYADEIKILRNIAKASVPKEVNYEAIPEINTDALAVDAACSGNPGKMEYQGVDVKSGIVLFHNGPFEGATNNIGEFLALVHGLAQLKKDGRNVPIYSDSKTAIAWVRDRKCKTKIVPTPQNEKVFKLVRRAEKWIQNNTFHTPIIKWKTEEWGEIPADFGRK